MLAGSRPEISASVVDLPQPVGPTTAQNSYTITEPVTSLKIDNPVGDTEIEGTDATTDYGSGRAVVAMADVVIVVLIMPDARIRCAW